MKKYFVLLVFSVVYVNGQVLQISNPNTNPNNLQLNPNTVPSISTNPADPLGKPENYKIGTNNEFNVQVKKGNYSSTDLWEDLFVYNTFVDNTVISHPNDTISGYNSNTNSSFVSFAFSGIVTIKITSNNRNIESVIIRPLSRGIQKTVTDNTITFTISKPDKFSVEINGDRYNNLHIFANDIINTTSAPYNTQQYSKVYEPNGGINSDGVYIYDTSLNEQSKKILIQSGAVLIVPYTGLSYTETNGKIKANNGDEFYIEEGGVLKGGIMLEGVSDVKIYGRGMIDLTNYPKNYNYYVDSSTYSFIQPITIRNSNDITLDGFVINDSQQISVEITDSYNLSINNLKIFSRVIWGDGIHMKGSRDINVNDCFIRTSDDGVAVYASRHTPSEWEISYKNNPALHINVENTSFYSDFAHPISVGWHGNCNTMDYYDPSLPYIEGLDIYNITFNNIDILEHDMYWIKPYGNDVFWHHTEYDGAMSINCGEGNRCSNILFNNIRIEDFTSGRLFSVNVEKGGFGAALTNGKSVEHIRFENITYNGTGESASTIRGLGCEEYVNGVHFNNFVVNGTVIKSLNGLDSYKITGGKEGIKTNEYAYNITFEEANRYTTSLSNGNYLIQNAQTGKYLQKIRNEYGDYIINTAQNTTITNNFPAHQIWNFELKPNSGHYYIKNLSDPRSLLKDTSNQFMGDELNPQQPYYCEGRYLETSNNQNSTTQEWKIEKMLLSNIYKIHNAHTRAFLTQDIIKSYAITRPEMFAINTINNVLNPGYNQNLQNWIIREFRPIRIPLTPINPKILATDKVEKNIFYPNPSKENLEIKYSEYSKDSKNVTVKILDFQGRIVYQNEIASVLSTHNISELKSGIYILILEDNEKLIMSEKLQKIK